MSEWWYVHRVKGTTGTVTTGPQTSPGRDITALTSTINVGEETAPDVTAPCVAAELRQREQDFLRAAFDNMLDPVVACDSHGRIHLVNRAMEQFAGLQPTGAPPESLSDYGDFYDVDGAPIALDDAPLGRALRGEVVHNVELVMQEKSGRRHSMIANGQRQFDTDDVLLGAIVVWHDVTAQREAEAGMAYQGLHDPLTGLPNRALFVDRVKLALKRARRQSWSTALLAINLDRFADIANRLGEDSGDQLLREVTQRLKATLRPYDSVSRPWESVARLGGDQFLLLCEDVADGRAAEVVASRIDAVLGAPMTIAGEAVRMTAGVGITLTCDPHKDPEALILEAETAMRRAKQRGSGRHEPFAPEMRAELHARMEDEDALRQALARNEFRVVYQPKVSLMTDRTTGVEALVRWHHPERGVIPPLEFIPFAEESGLIVPIGSWVLDQVCRDAQRWSKSVAGGLPLMVAINVSPGQFESGLAERIGNIISSAGIDPATVCLEVTEGMVMEDAEFAISTLRELKALGVGISIDDFGTGFSSLAYLKRFPLDELKIDKTFVDGLGQDPEDTAIVAAVMGMAHALNLRVVAEGVETADQVARLRTLGCDEAQGYYYARPGTVADIDDLLLAESSTKPARQEPPRVRGRGSTRAKRVLVVDDTADVRELARASLAAVGFEVKEACSGEEAITLTTQFRPDCVVLDLNLPGISGLDVCRLLRADPQNKHMTIVILTVDAEAREKVEAFYLNADDYMIKPFSPRDIVGRVAAAMRRRTGVSA
jgi:diguanylate cyclase (GGDEF)-like protein/PAS domain S-box-containing protein